MRHKAPSDALNVPDLAALVRCVSILTYNLQLFASPVETIATGNAINQLA